MIDKIDTSSITVDTSNAGHDSTIIHHGGGSLMIIVYATVVYVVLMTLSFMLFVPLLPLFISLATWGQIIWYACYAT